VALGAVINQIVFIRIEKIFRKRTTIFGETGVHFWRVGLDENGFLPRHNDYYIKL